VRSSTNVNAGARSRASAVLHGVWILLFTVPFAELVEKVPTAALAGLLIVIGVQLLKPAHIETAMKQGDLAVYIVTAVCVIFLNLLHGVLIGLTVAIALTGWRVIRARVEAKPVGDQWHVAVEGAAWTFRSITSITPRTRRSATGSASTRPQAARFGNCAQAIHLVEPGKPEVAVRRAPAELLN
jgi:MFS superfamily sulfate permease-like transporter